MYQKYGEWGAKEKKKKLRVILWVLSVKTITWNFIEREYEAQLGGEKHDIIYKWIIVRQGFAMSGGFFKRLVKDDSGLDGVWW